MNLSLLSIHKPRIQVRDLASGLLVRHARDAFEHEIAAYLGRHVRSTGSGRSAIKIALNSLGTGPGDEVIMPAFTCSSVGEAVLETGATPVFADVAKDSVNVDAASIAAMITPRTRAAIVAHIFGIPAQMDSLRELLASRGIPVIEDCCQSFGARFNGDLLGTIGSFGTFSFGISKNIAVGAGGLSAARTRIGLKLTGSHRMRRPIEGRQAFRVM